MSRRRRAGVAALLAGWVAAASLGPGAAPAAELRYALPGVGSYELPVIDRVSAHRLVGSAGDPTPVLSRVPGGVTVVGFVYLDCADPHGCPLSLATLQRLDAGIAARPELAPRVQLVTVSFDPANDTPEAMARMRLRMAPRTGWRFLTAASQEALRPVLEDFGQDAVPQQTRAGSDRAMFRHVAKVFLVDADGGVRNVYSAGFLDHRLLLRDIETLLAGP